MPHNSFPNTGPEAPSIEHLIELQGIGVALAKRQASLRESKDTDRAHLFMPKELRGYELPKQEHPYEWTLRYVGRVARTDYRRWSMRITESYWLRDDLTDQNEGFRTQYSFEWTDKDVITASKRIRARFLPIAAKGFEDAESIREADVTAVDCENLSYDMRQFGDASHLMHFRVLGQKMWSAQINLFNYDLPTADDKAD